MGAESSLAAQPCARVVLLCFNSMSTSSVGRPASPFIGKGKARVTAEEEEKNERESEEGFHDCRVLFLLHAGPADPVDANRDGSMSPALFVTGAIRGRHLSVMAFHSVPADIVVN